MYSSPKDNNQIKMVWENKILKEQFIDLVIIKIKFKNCKECISKIILKINELVENNKNDDEIYKILRNYVHNVLYKSEEYKNIIKKNNREINRILEIKKIINLTGYKNYLDIGCGDGTITQKIGEYMNLKKENINGCDIIHCNNNNITFKLLGESLSAPYSDNSFDIITLFMSLHHISYDISFFIKEIYRITTNNGIVIIREHEVNDENLKILLDVMHGFYAMVYNDEMRDFRDHFANYQNDEYWSSLFVKNGFKKIKSTYPKGPWNYYYAIYQKIL